MIIVFENISEYNYFEFILVVSNLILIVNILCNVLDSILLIKKSF